MAETLAEVLTEQERVAILDRCKRFEGQLRRRLLDAGGSMNAQVLDWLVTGSVAYGTPGPGDEWVLDQDSDLDVKMLLDLRMGAFTHPQGPAFARRIWRGESWRTFRHFTFRTGLAVQVTPATIRQLSRKRDYQPFMGFSLVDGRRLDLDEYGNIVWTPPA